MAPAAVTVMTPVRGALSGLGSTVTLMVPELLPLFPEVICTQEGPVVTEAVQAMVPPPVLDTEKVVLPPEKAMLREEGETARAGGELPKLTVNEIVAPADPMLVISIPPGEPSLRKQVGLLVALKVVLPDSAEKLAEEMLPLTVVVPSGLNMYTSSGGPPSLPLSEGLTR